MTTRDEAVRLANSLRSYFSMVTGLATVAEVPLSTIRKAADMLELLSRPAEGVVVPREPTDKMLNDLYINTPGIELEYGGVRAIRALREGWKAMLAAAPAQPSEDMRDAEIVKLAAGFMSESNHELFVAAVAARRSDSWEAK